MAGAGVLCVVIGKFRYKKKLCSIILLEVNKDLKIGFHHIILLLSLAVCLWVEDTK